MESLRYIDYRLTGLSASPGIAIGTAQLLKKGVVYANPVHIEKESTLEHEDLFHKSRARLLEELEHLQDTDLSELEREMIHTQEQILLDIEIEERVIRLIHENLYSADYAIYDAFNVFIELLKDSGSAMFKSRVVDLEDVRNRLIHIVCDRATDFKLVEDAILIAEDIGPVDLVTLANQGLKGVVLDKGGINAHASILAQSFEMPMIVGARKATKKIEDGDTIIIDAENGDILVNPEKKTLKKYQKLAKALTKEEAQLKRLVNQPSETKSGDTFHLLANLEFENEISTAVDNGAQGVGLVRTESLLFANKSGVDELVQIGFYRKLLIGTEGPFTIRLFDVGGDKFVSAPLNEANPVLGWRGIRVLLDEKHVLADQLRAIYKASIDFKGRIQLLAPMVSGTDEIKQLKQIMEGIKTELVSDGFDVDENLKLGIMIEVPSSVLLATELGKYVDFFSIGTNDLTQYILAVDRGNELISKLYDQRNPAIWRMIKMVVEAANQRNLTVTVCGELAGDPKSAAVLMGLGITKLSMNPVKIPRVKATLMNHTTDEFKNLANQVLNLESTEEIIRLFNSWN